MTQPLVAEKSWNHTEKLATSQSFSESHAINNIARIDGPETGPPAVG